jgi:hypothetical protein
MRVVVVPGTLALLPEYASIEDPIPDLRKAVTEAVAWLLEEGGARVLSGASPAGRRIGRHLLADDASDGPGLLVIGSGSAMRTEKAPGHFDPRAEEFDAFVARALAAGDRPAIDGIDSGQAGELWADVEDIKALGADRGGRFEVTSAEVDFDDAPYGVQYWVVRWQCR